MAIMFVRAQVISRGSGRSVVSAAAYRHRTKMTDEQAGTTFRYEGGASELVHEELALPDAMPAWLKDAIEGKSVSAASELLWNAVEAFEKREDAQLARELIIALPEELGRAENIALMREFVASNFTAKGMVADWVYHDKDGNPHVHLMTTLRPLAKDGFGPKKVPVVGEDGIPLRVVTPDRLGGKIVYRIWAGDREAMKAWKLAWAEAANRHLALAGVDIRLDGRSYAEQGREGIAQRHLGPAKAAMVRKGSQMFLAPAELARRQDMADRLAADPGLLLRQLGNERSTFDERDIARALHRYVDDPDDFANIRAQLIASPDLVMLRPQRLDPETGRRAEPAIYTTHDMLRVEHGMARSADNLAQGAGFGVAAARIASAIESVEGRDPDKPFKLDREQVDAVRHVTSDAAIAAVVGLAGAGKSTLLAAARVAWESDGRRVLGAALAGKAAEGLEDSSGIASRTLASWELAWANGRDRLERGDVLVIDEAGMVSSQQMARVLKVAEDAEAKVVLVGDAMQLQPIQAGAAFRAIAERIGFAELAGVRRQRDEWARNASRLFARGEVETALDAYARHGHIVEAATREDAIGRIVTDWTEAWRALTGETAAEGERQPPRGDELLVLAHTNEDVKRLNEALRKVLTDDGALSANRTFTTERGTREFAAGDRIIFLENARFVEPRAKHLGPQHVKNGMLGSVTSTSDKRGRTLLTVHLDNGREVVFGEDTYRNVDHGYAATIHKAQGATVDRTFVLGTGMMDQHLTYVAMSRHRDRADLYAAQEDFEPRGEWGRKPRVDHAGGVTGELLEIGQAKFREGEDVAPSPYADVRADNGSTHRLWGVSLPAALAKGGVSVGDTVTLRKDGVETVTVKIPVTDEETGERRLEERQVERNVWTAKQLETVEDRSERIDRESHRPDVFTQLVERLSRSGAKTTTLDYESEPSYQAHARDFARLRGIDQLAGAAAGMEEGVARRLAWFAEKRGELARLWERASVALGFAIERERSIAYSDTRLETPVRQPDAESRFLLAPVTRFARSLEEDARRAQIASPAVKEREGALLPVLERIYRDPDAAMVRLHDLASGSKAGSRELGDVLARSPEQLGLLRGRDASGDGGAARHERATALKVVAAELVPLARAHAAAFKKSAPSFEIREEQRRAHMALSVPALSANTLARLSELETVRIHGGEGAYEEAFAFAAEDRAVVQEIKAVNEALTARFGWSAFTDRADAVAERNMADRLPEDTDPQKHAELKTLFESVRRFAHAQHLAERQDRSRVVAPAPYRPDAPGAAPLMLPAVVEFRTSIEDEARERVVATPHYRQQRAALGEIASRIWRDPSAAVAKIEDLVAKGFAAERIVAAVSNEPSAYGALRGSDRLVDRLLAAGRERRDALAAVPAAAAELSALGSVYADGVDIQSKAIAEERRLMAIPIPGLSKPAHDELARLASEAKKDTRALTAMVARLDPAIREEFASVSKALDARFGRNAIARGEKDAINRVPAAQRRTFEAMGPSLKVLQQAVRIEASEKILSERRMRTINQARGLGR
ncbi:MAG: Ti-type conjugative transfer relaxase TraA [Rhizobiales bacterium 24-66-13]|nr:MAG: Ti-type conjugative transfer relaxase TraA [Rhizobiales bacterium 32-66-11]OYY88609.1 MAG: Ti-type conjugative transfer relaxase TraA [Rhizobiales bacterium 35-66-30]OYZ75417.1 MAG: Ti-type conjugative transfer relaxase TraA [Rhizobiales bacterium 24-66-13]OZB03659.1 MAG: Ti-type conjugative transfer relaxase TraA [Rhizobiales bacterium 39-66-18]